MVTHQLQVRCRPVTVRRSETDVLPLSYTASAYAACFAGAYCTYLQRMARLSSAKMVYLPTGGY